MKDLKRKLIKRIKEGINGCCNIIIYIPFKKYSCRSCPFISFVWITIQRPNIDRIHPKLQTNIIFRTRLPRKSDIRFKLIILCMPSDWNYLKFGWIGSQVEWGFDSWRSWNKICITDQKSLIHLPWTVNGASLVLLWSMAVWQGFYTERETPPLGELEHWLGSRVISRSFDRVWVGVRPLYRTMGTPARLGPVASVTMMLHLRSWTTEAPASQSVFNSGKDLQSQKMAVPVGV